METMLLKHLLKSHLSRRLVTKYHGVRSLTGLQILY